MRRILFILGLVWLNINIYSQNVNVQVNAPGRVGAGEQFRVVFTINGKVSNFQPPDFKDFDVLMGPSTSRSSNIQVINGRMSQSITISYSYVLSAPQEGSFTIGSAEVVVDNKTYKSNPKTIVVAGGTPSNASSNNNPAPTNSTPDISASENEDIFMRLYVDRNKLYQGEHLVATLKIYTRIDIARLNDFKNSAYSGFWSQELYNPDYIKWNIENINGAQYHTGIVRQDLLYPQRSGELIIDAAELGCLVRKYVNRGFFSVPQDKDIKLKSPKVRVYVKPLPDNKPASFTGGVGKFSISSSVDKTELKANEAITFKVRISGKGNIKLIESPNINFPPDFEVFDPKLSSKVDNASTGSSGSKTFEYIIIPRYAGDFKIPALEFSYFDSDTKKYKTLSTKEIDIKVEKGYDDPQSTVMSGFSKEDVQVLGSDIMFIKTDPVKFKEIGNHFYKSLIFYMSYVLSLVLFIGIIIFRRKKIKEKSNVSLVKNKRANKLARKRLKSAGKYLKENNKDEFYKAVLMGMWGYLSDKLNIDMAKLSRDTAIEALQKHDIQNVDLERLMALIDNCEYAQYAPEKNSSQMYEFYNEAIKLVSLLEQNVK